MHPDRIRIAALTAYSNVDELARQVLEFQPRAAVIGDEALLPRLRELTSSSKTRLLTGSEAMCEVAASADVDTVLASVVGFAGLAPVMAALQNGKKVALANKEALVVAGALVRDQVGMAGSVLLPVDSEHSAIFQCLVGEAANDIETLTLTASGGPFRTRPVDTFASITRAEALAHPNWSMGEKITIDSATMMNKGLEVIEAHWLFDVDPLSIEVLVHPQSIVHSMVTFQDGSTKAQLGVPDMKVPIQYALSYPHRWPAPHARLDWPMLSTLNFELPDLERFPCLAHAYRALEASGTAPAVLNAANEEAVAFFLQGQIRFTDIPDLIGEAVAKLSRRGSYSLDEVVEADDEARSFVRGRVASRIGTHPGVYD